MKARRRIIVYIATSADGYIARPDGDIEWLNRHPSTSDYGMRDFYPSIDTILWGRKTYDWANNHDWLLEDYDILYGGIDSDSTITRLTDPNAIMSAVAGRFANEAACAITAWDFTKDKSTRTFFSLIDLTEVPESAGHTVDGSVGDIKANIQFLHKYLLDETLDLTDPEIDRTYQLFLDTWHELSQSGDTSLPNNCQGQWNPNDGTNLPMNVQINDNKNYTLRSWMAVMTYLLSDYKFLYE